MAGATEKAPERMVPVRAPDGRLGTVPASQVKANIDAGGSLATQEDLRKAAQEEEYGGVGGAAAAAGFGALRGASFGLSDPLIVGVVGEKARKTLEGYQEANPISSLGGELAGVVAPALFSGGAGAVGAGAKALSAPVRALGAVGRGAEGLAGRIVGREAGSVLGRVGQRAITGAVGTAVEGAAYGVGHEISDAAIHDHELTAEKLWAGAGNGALIGGALGAAAGTVGQLGREALGAAGRIVRSPGVSSWLERQSLESTGRAAGVNKAIARNAEAHGDFDAMRRFWRDEAPGIVGKRNFAHMTRDDLAEAAELLAARDGASIGEALDAADSMLGGVARDLPAIPKAPKPPRAPRLESPRALKAEDARYGIASDFDAGLRTGAASEKMNPIVAGERDVPWMHFGEDPGAVTKAPAIELRRGAGGRIERKLPIEVEREPLSFVRDRARIDPNMIEGAEIAPGPIRLTAKGAELNPRMVEGAEVGRPPLRIVSDAEATRAAQMAPTKAKNRALLDSYAEALAQHDAAMGARSRAIAEHASASANSKMPLARDVIADFDRVAASIESSKLGGRTAANRLREIAEDVRRQMGLVDGNGQYLPHARYQRMSMRDIHGLRVRADEAIGNFGPELHGYKADMHDVRVKLEARIKAGIEASGSKQALDRYMLAKQKYQAWKTLQKATENASAGASSNRFFGLSEHIGGGVASVVGGVLGSALGPVGTLGGALLGKAVGAAGSHLLRTRGDFVAASLLGHVAQLGAIEKATAMVDHRIGAGVRAFLSGGNAPVRSHVARNEKDQARALRVAQVVTMLANDDDARNERIGASIGGFGQYAPNVATHASIKAHQAIYNLAMAAPKPMHASHSFQLGHEKLRYAPSAVYDFSRYLDGYETPLSVLDDMRRGRLDPLKMRAVQENHPRLYEEMRAKLSDAIVNHTKPLSWEQKKIASMFFGLPADDTLDPGFISRLHQGIPKGDAPKEEAPGQQMGGRRPIDIDTNIMRSPTEDIASPI